MNETHWNAGIAELVKECQRRSEAGAAAFMTVEKSTEGIFTETKDWPAYATTLGLSQSVVVLLKNVFKVTTTVFSLFDEKKSYGNGKRH